MDKEKTRLTIEIYYIVFRDFDSKHERYISSSTPEKPIPKPSEKAIKEPEKTRVNIKIYARYKRKNVELKTAKHEVKHIKYNISAIASPVELYKTIPLKAAKTRLRIPAGGSFKIKRLRIGKEGIYDDLSPIGILHRGYVELYPCAALVNICYENKCEDASGMLVPKDLTGIGIAIADGVTQSLGVVSHAIIRALQAFVYEHSRLPNLDELKELSKIASKTIVENPGLDRSVNVSAEEIIKRVKSSPYDTGASTLSAVYIDLRRREITYVVIGDATLAIFNANFSGKCAKIPFSNALTITQHIPQASVIASRLGHEPFLCPSMTYYGTLKLVTDDGLALVASDGAKVIVNGKAYHVFDSVKGNPLHGLLDRKPNEIIKNIAPKLIEAIGDDISLGVITFSPDKECLEKIKKNIESYESFRLMLSKLREVKRNK